MMGRIVASLVTGLAALTAVSTAAQWMTLASDIGVVAGLAVLIGTACAATWIFRRIWREQQ